MMHGIAHPWKGPSPRVLLLIAFLFVAHGIGWAATQPSPGEYTGRWMGRDGELGRQGGEVRVIISTNREVTLLMTFINHITGGVVVHRFDGVVRRNGRIRGGDTSARFRAVPQRDGFSLRGVWFFPIRDGSVSRRRFYANHE